MREFQKDERIGRCEPKTVRTGKDNMSVIILGYEHESLILAQDERWRRA